MPNKRVLIITYYWPPAGGPGVQRWLKFAKYLPENHWQPIIYTPENPSYPLLDESLLKEVPADIEVLRHKILEPYAFAERISKQNKRFKAGRFDVQSHQSLSSRSSVFVRGNFFIPDARMLWINPSVKFLTRYLESNPVDVLVTTGPPHSMHLIGLKLKKRFSELKWIADFRDPWTQISYYKHLKLTRWADRKHHDLEKQVFLNADLTLATSFSDAVNFKAAGATTQTLTNGFDGSLLERKARHDNKFVISYVGVLEQLRNPKVLWQVLTNLVSENQDFAKSLEIKFVGEIDEFILNSLQQSPLRRSLNLKGYLPHDWSQREMADSDLLLLMNFPQSESKGIIPGKLFEYLQTQNPILSIGPADADVELILNETHAGQHFTNENAKDIQQFILLCFEHWKNKTQTVRGTNIEKYSRRNLTLQLAKTLDRISGLE